MGGGSYSGELNAQQGMGTGHVNVFLESILLERGVILACQMECLFYFMSPSGRKNIKCGG